MDVPDTTTLYLLLFSNAAMLAAACIAIVRFQKQCRRFEIFWNSPTGASLASRTPAADTLANPQLENRVTELQNVVKTLVNTEQRERALVNGSLPIENAVRMARYGASIDELIRSCGLNIGEAQLMQKLHGKVQAAAIGK